MKLDPKLLKGLQIQARDKTGRLAFEEKRGKQVPVMRDIEEAEVFSHRIEEEAGTVTVVTDQGRKVSGALPKGWTPPKES